ncbi:TIGR04372 family glycosyltransferase [Bradyrhizobium betae]
MDWVLSSPHSDRYVNELVVYLLLCGYEKQVLTLVPNIDWGQDDDYFTLPMEALIEKLTSGYFMDLLAQYHAIEWTALPKRLFLALEPAAKLMIEHRTFTYEQRSYEAHQLKDKTLWEAPAATYIHRYFVSLELIKKLLDELEMLRDDATLAARQEAGQYWEHFPANHPQREVLFDVNLFYAYRHLLLTTYHSGEGFYVPKVHGRMSDVQVRLRRSLPKPSQKLTDLLHRLEIDHLADVRLLSPDWSALIGHTGHLNVHLMMREMGWWHGKPLLLAYKDRIANRPFLSLFSEICPTIVLDENVTSDVWYELASLTPFIGISHQAFGFEDGRAMYWNDAGSLALKQWESEGRGFPLRDIYDRRMLADGRIEQIYQSMRRKWGMDDRDWYVCLHVRDAETRNDAEGAGESIRNASLRNYLDAVHDITSRGGWVVRMGGRKAPPLPEMPRVIDYARSADQMPEMDIHLVRRARMFIGTTSGFAYVATSFGIPTAMVNALSSVGLLWSTDTLFALKPVHRSDGRMLSLGELTSERYRWAYPTYESLYRAGLTVTESSSDEISETVREVLELSDPERSRRYPGVDGAWERCVKVPGFFGSSRPSKYFLEKYGSEFLADD